MVDTDVISLNLQTYEREDKYQPFNVVLPTGVKITLTDPADLEWTVLAGIEKPVQFFRFVIPEDQKKAFKDANLTGWQLNELVSKYVRHYGLDTAGNAAASLL